MDTRVETNRSATALRALKVLEVLGEANGPQSVVNVAEALGADRSTAYRMLMTLMDAGYVARDARTGGYRLGYKVLTLGRSLLARDERNELILSCLHEISAETQETAHYSVLDRDAAVLVLRAKGTQLVTVDFQIGDRAPLHCSSIGKALLAYQDARLVEEVIAAGLPQMGPNTITDPARLRAELESVRIAGYAYDELEFAPDMRCVAVPVFEEGGVVRGGISLSGPASRYTPGKLKQLKDDVVAASRRLSRQLGATAE
ncbi:IclR family transcriptional regulator [Aquisalimonas sp.]|uniref:IclR family transcriptional regulator n=1 Tax=Aquisalimonas sp. TaxID=1872621 RepID=UPI0025C61526|nr:IclR family transcriptional regulator [Aquisalimonas sp.]